MNINLILENITQPTWFLFVLVDKIAQGIGSDRFVLGVFLDFSKAFDIVNHHMLLQRLYAYGIRSEAH